MYELLSEAGKDASALSLRDAFAEALTLFRTRDFDRAREAFKDISVRFPADQPARLYIKRCDEYIRSGPPEDWDGVFVAKTK
jgi:adenylate cyclase